MSIPTDKQLSEIDFCIGWVCILEKGYYAAFEVLDDTCSLEGRSTDAYELGQIGDHNVVINVPGSGEGGLLHARDITTQMKSDFPSIRFILLVGISGGAPALPRDDIRLGDVVFGSYVIHYMKGRRIEGDNAFEIVPTRLEPPEQLAQTVTRLRRRLRNEPLDPILEEIANKSDSNREAYRRPADDRLLESTYLHKARGCECLHPGLTNSQRLIHREPRQSTNSIRTHRGVVGSADQVLKNAQDRDRLNSQQRIICFEMEAAAVIRSNGCITIRGIADYADGHRNDDWHDYAALSAAVCAKELLVSLDPRTVLDVETDLNLEEFRSYFKKKSKLIDTRLSKNESDGQRAIQAIQKANNELEQQTQAFTDFANVQEKTDETVDQLKTFQKDLAQQVQKLEGKVESKQKEVLNNNYVTREEWNSLKKQVEARKQQANHATEAFGVVGDFTDLLGDSLGNKHVKDVSKYTRWAGEVSGKLSFPRRKSTEQSSPVVSGVTSPSSPYSTPRTSISKDNTGDSLTTSKSRKRDRLWPFGKTSKEPTGETPSCVPNPAPDCFIDGEARSQTNLETSNSSLNTQTYHWMPGETRGESIPSPLSGLSPDQSYIVQLPPRESPPLTTPSRRRTPPPPPLSTSGSSAQRTSIGGFSTSSHRRESQVSEEPQVSEDIYEDQESKLPFHEKMKRFQDAHNNDR